MRISDWSSDVCSSDLSAAPQPSAGALTAHDSDRSARRRPGLQSSSHLADDLGSNSLASHLEIEAGPATGRGLSGRKSGVAGKGVAVRVEHGGRRHITKKK